MNEATTVSHHRAPVPDPDSRPYWEALEQHCLVVQRCLTCGTYRCPPLPSCHVCGSERANWEEATGAGSIYSWITVHRAVGNLLVSEVPVTFVTVEFVEGFRLVLRCVGPGRPAIGAAVGVDYVDHADWTEPVVRATAKGSTP